jgi:hypothetical protein
MSKKKKLKRFSAVAAVKALARERIGMPPSEQIAPNRTKKKKSLEKHKPTLGRLMQEEQ